MRCLGGEPSKRRVCGIRPVAERVKSRERHAQPVERHVSFERQPCQPPAGGALVEIGLLYGDYCQDRERVLEVDRRQFGSHGSDEREVATLDRVLEPAVGRTLDRHEHMFQQGQPPGLVAQNMLEYVVIWKSIWR